MTPLTAFLSPESVATAKIVVASAGAALLTWGWWLRRSGSPERRRRQRDAVLVTVGVLGAACWGNLLQFRPGFVHGWDVYHHYIGAKYFRELGYTKLYECAVVADAEDGLHEQARTREVRDLETDRIILGSRILADPRGCTGRFSLARWAMFKQDHAWFRERTAPERWARMQRDHGYNATPVSSAIGSLLAGSGPVSWTRIALLVLLDPVLLAAMWATVWWAFGWRAMCVAMVYWGTNFPARFAWTGGSFLRHDWLALSIVGLCLLRRGFAGAAGFAVAWATCLRVYPAGLLGGIVSRGVVSTWRGRSPRWPGPYRRLAVGAGLALAVLMPLGSAVGGGWHVWGGFWDNAVKHATSPITNRMGLATLAAYDHGSRARLLALGQAENAADGWEGARRRALGRRGPLLVAAAIAFATMLAWAASKQPDWVAAILGAGLIAVGDATCYYYSILLAYGLLGDRREGIGAALCALSAAGGVIATLTPWDDELYALLSVTTLTFVVGATIAMGRRPLGEPGALG